MRTHIVMFALVAAGLAGCGGTRAGGSEQSTLDFEPLLNAGERVGGPNNWVAFPLDLSVPRKTVSQLASDQAVNLYTRFGCPGQFTSDGVVEGLLSGPAASAQLAHLDTVTLEAVSVELGPFAQPDFGATVVCVGYRTSDESWTWQKTEVAVDPETLSARLPVNVANITAVAVFPSGELLRNATIEARHP